MIRISNNVCNNCGTPLAGETQQFYVYCDACGYMGYLCRKCQLKGCPDCHSKIQNGIERSAADGFIYP